MLCDMRDLAHCIAVNKQWHGVGQRVLYEELLRPLPMLRLLILHFSADITA